MQRKNFKDLRFTFFFKHAEESANAQRNEVCLFHGNIEDKTKSFVGDIM